MAVLSTELGVSIDWIITGKETAQPNGGIMQGLTSDQQDEVKRFIQKLRESNEVKDELAKIKQKVGL